MFKKNTAVTGFAVGLVSATDGSDITTGTPVGYYTLDGGTQTAIADVTPVHEGNGLWTFDLLAAEMNGDIVGLTFTHTSAITAHFTIKTETKLVSELNDVAATDIVSSGAITTAAGAVSNVSTVATLAGHTAQTGDTYALANGSNGFVATKADTAAILIDTADMQPKLGTPAADISADIAAIKTDTDSMGITKNSAFSNFEFPMVLTSDHYTAATAKTVAGEKSIDGGAFAAVSGTIAEVGSGVYQCDLLAADTNGDVITYKFSATDCDDTIITVTTRA